MTSSTLSIRYSSTFIECQRTLESARRFLRMSACGLGLACTLMLSSILAAQVPDPVSAAQVPQGDGHHYIGMGAETVNPADGSVSFDLPIQLPAGRGISMPFGTSLQWSSATLRHQREYEWAPLVDAMEPSVHPMGLPLCGERLDLRSPITDWPEQAGRASYKPIDEPNQRLHRQRELRASRLRWRPAHPQRWRHV
jgi:hypothetical protein